MSITLINTWNKNFLNKIYILAFIPTLLIVVFFGLIQYRADAKLSSNNFQIDNTNIITSNSVLKIPSNTSSVVTSSPQLTPMREVHVANNGLILLRGARVISIRDKNMTVAIMWDNFNFNWEIKTHLSTGFTDGQGKKITINNIEIGDYVTVIGNIIKGGEISVVNASFVRI